MTLSRLTEPSQFLPVFCSSSCVAWSNYLFSFSYILGAQTVKIKSACNVGELGSTPGLGRSLEEGHGNPLQYSCLENPHGQRSLAGYSPWGHEESDTTEQLNWTELLFMFLSFLCQCQEFPRALWTISLSSDHVAGRGTPSRARNSALV